MKKTAVLFFTAIITLSACNTGKHTTAQGSDERSDIATRSEIADPAHNSRNSVDWAGVYKGLIPCADCPGIEDEIRLNADLTYERVMVYLERGDSRFSEKGRFEWDESGGKVRLINEESPDQGGNWFRVGENRLIMLDVEGNPIENNIPAEMYVYQKIDLDHIITEKYWKLIELNGREVAPAEEGRREAHIILKNDNNRIVGSTGCNNLMGTYEISESFDSNSISFSPMATTRMACIGIDYEQEFLNVFEDCDGYSIENDTLTLSREKVKLAKFVAVYLR